MVDKQESYIPYYTCIQMNKELSPIEKGILQLLVHFTVLDKDCFMSEEYLSQYYGSSRATITRGKRALKEKGLITVQSKFVCGEKKTTLQLKVRAFNDFLGREFITEAQADSEYPRSKSGKRRLN